MSRLSMKPMMSTWNWGGEKMKQYVYYATGEKVESIRFLDNEKAWCFVLSHGGYDCVVERYEMG